MKLVPILAVLATVSPVAASDISQELDQVVVTASRVEEKLKEAPVTINVLDKTEVEKIKYRNPSDILTRIPGIYSHDFGGDSEITSIRVATHFTNPYTIVLLDGIPVSNYGSGSSGQFAEINSDNISRVEVIKGPASALYGSNAIGGVINIISKDPSAKPQLKVWSEYGRGEAWRSGISGSGSGEKASFNIDLNYIDNEGWRDNNNLEKKSASIKLQVPISESLMTFKVDYLKKDNQSPSTLTKSEFEGNWQHSYHDLSMSKTDKIAPTISYSYFLEQAEFKTTLSLKDIDSESRPTYGIRLLTFGANTGKYQGRYNQNDDKAANLQFLYSREFTALASKIVTGLDTERSSVDFVSYDIYYTKDAALNKYTSFTTGSKNSSDDITTTMYAPFLQIQVTPIDTLKFTAGGRYDSVKYDFEDMLNNSNNGEKEFDQFSPKLGLTYDFTARLNSYLSYSKGFVVPTTSQLFTSTGANANLTPEKADNYEFGIRSALFQNKLGLDFAIYSMEITDKIVSSGSGWSDPYINAGKTSQRGFEASAVYAPIDMVKLTMAYSYARNKYDNYSPASPQYNGNTVPRSPKHHLNIRLAVLPMDCLEFELEMDEISTQYHDDANLFEYSRPTLFNLRATYNREQWSAWTHLKNLTNQTYATYVSESSGAPTFYSGAPLSLFAGISYKWGE
nr:TonB-dependent receptor [Desulfobulbaceae bacterium]